MKTETQGAWVFWQKHQVRPAFDSSPKGSESGVPRGQDTHPVMQGHQSTLDIGSGQRSRLRSGPKLPFLSFWEVEINIGKGHVLLSNCTIFKLLMFDIIFSTVINLIEYTWT